MFQDDSERLAEVLKKTAALHAEANRLQLEKIQIVQSYRTPDDAHCGIGYLDGKLVEFSASKSEDLTASEITLRESADWMQKMLWMEIRFPLDVDLSDEGRAKWYFDLHAEL